MKQIKFEEFKISEKIKRAINDLGYIYATEIQAKTIPSVLEGKDVIGQSQTGTGKTASFAIPILEKINSNNKNLQSIILCPTRELAMQVAQEIRKFAKYMEGIKTSAIYGGTSIENQIRELKRGVQIVIGTPGRVMDHIRRKTIKLENISIVVLDEADEMLSMGFEEDIESILKDTNPNRQTLLFSATMPKTILSITKKYQKNPVHVKVENTEHTMPKIEQVYYELKEKMKLETLIRVLEIHNPKSCLVFCNTKRKVDNVIETLKQKGYSAEALHGDIAQSHRDRIMKSFKQGNFKILVATDVAARGIDVNDLEIVINFDIPQEKEHYVHRIGRTGRGGKTGKAFTMVVGKERFRLKEIEKFANTKIKAEKLPTIGQVNEMRRNKIKKQILDVIQTKEYIDENIINELITEKVDATDIAKALLTMKTGKTATSENKTLNSASIQDKNGMVEVFINVGKLDNIRVKDIIGSIVGNTGISGEDIGKVNLLEKYSFAEIQKEYIEDVIVGMKNKQIKGKDVNIEIANKTNK
ncbi:MAG: DEAD/DEAH box helicase [Oscillospiraceae bacterium]|nr:DEAD/DEAH box helicase [Oscillospiraceae bacterium]